MNCERIQELILTDYSDGRLSDKWMKEIDSHLATCPSCAALALQMKRIVVEPLRDVKRYSPNPGVWINVNEAIREKQEVRIPWSVALRPAFFALSTFVILGVLILQYQGEQVKPQAKQQSGGESYMTALLDGETTATTGDAVTNSIETYFL